MSIHDIIDLDNLPTSPDEGSEKEGGVRLLAILRRVFVPFVILLVGLLGYGLGRLGGAGERPPVKIEYDPNIISNSQFPISNQTPISNDQTGAGSSKTENSGGVYASSKGTKYYYPSCKSTVSETNKITFATAALAEASGYALATNCKKP